MHQKHASKVVDAAENIGNNRSDIKGEGHLNQADRAAGKDRKQEKNKKRLFSGDLRNLWKGIEHS